MQNKLEIMDTVKRYYAEMGMDAVFSDNTSVFFRAVIAGHENAIVCSNNRLARGIAKIRGMKRVPLNSVETISHQYFALKDAFLLLAKKDVAVYFYNRVGLKKSGYEYSGSAKRRMNQELSFPVMYEDISLYKADFKELIGEKYSEEYVQQIGKIPQVIAKGDEYCHEDCKSQYINVVGGKRVTCFQPQNFERTIHIYGRCGVFGYAVEDADTFPSQLQKLLSENDISSIRVVNHGLWGGTDDYVDHNFLKDCVGFKQGDIVLFYRKHYDKRLLARFIDEGMWYREITEEWHQNEIAHYSFYDRPGHMSADGYKLVAKLVYEDMKKHEFKPKPVSGDVLVNLNTPALTQYLKSNGDTKFQEGIVNYTSSVLQEYPRTADIQVCGSIVMNCNPFTKGHRYLIEFAAKRVDRLYIFVVEEDRSFFKFEDRFEMVVKGTEDLKNVVVIPSGKFIISSITFPEYFLKDYVKEKNLDVSMDLEVFCKYIAPPLHIKVRFAGEEPFDPVTFNYNESMKQILPEYGIDFYEIPRLMLDSESVIKATEVRRLLKEKNFEAISEYVPTSTLEILKSRYS